MACEIHLGDIGTAFRLTILDCSGTPVDISAASAMEVIFRKPDSTVVVQTGVFYTDGTDGIVQYVTIANDLDQTGTWKIQAEVTLPTGTWSSNVETFKVYKNLKSVL